ncbi:MAG: hypothetical protein NVS2B3_02570 [Vulcanimicrobiaceae bacterium]
MNDTSSKIAVIATRMPYIDRRSLSQAWFSALHLASDGPVAGRADRRVATPGAEPTPRVPSPGERAGQPTRGSGAHARATSAARDANPVRATLEMTTRRASDARVAATARTAYERARSYPPFATTLTLDTNGERVQLVLRRQGATLHVVALCRPEVAETVRRALACADSHVRLRGEAIRSSVHVALPEAIAP